jgi:hypothetical protein
MYAVTQIPFGPPCWVGSLTLLDARPVISHSAPSDRRIVMVSPGHPIAVRVQWTVEKGVRIHLHAQEVVAVAGGSRGADVGTDSLELL